MARVCYFKGVSYSYIIAELTNNHNIRILSHSLYNPIPERFHVSANLPMPYYTFLWLMNQLYRCRNDNNVSPYGTIICINNGVESSGLPRARNTGNQR